MPTRLNPASDEMRTRPKMDCPCARPVSPRKLLVPRARVHSGEESVSLSKVLLIAIFPSVRDADAVHSPLYNSRVCAAGQVLLQGCLVADGRKVGVGHGLLCRETFLGFVS